MFSFFSKTNKITDINWLGVDMHSHILPGIDDGAPDVETALHLVKELAELGYEKLIASPHIFKTFYPNTADTIANAQALLQGELDKNQVPVSLDAGAEYMVDLDFEINDDLCTLKAKHILIEMSYIAETPNISDQIFNLQIKGYQPVLAHPERYVFYHRDLKTLKQMKETGCLLQLNLLAIIGYYGKEVKKATEVLLKEKMYDLAGTDLHHIKHLAALTTAVQTGRLYELIGQYPFKNREIF